MTQKLVNAIFTLCACLTGCVAADDTAGYHAHATLARSISRSVAKELKKTFNLDCEGEQGSWDPNISQITMSLRTERRATIEEARELLIRSTERLLSALNGNEQIRPHLAEYPFPPERVKISLRFDSMVEYYSCNFVCHVFTTNNGTLYYSASTETLEKREDLFKESYADALNIVKQSNLSDITVSQHTKRPYEDLLDSFCSDFIKGVYKGLKIKTYYLSADAGEKIKELSFVFVREKPMQLEEARKLEVTIMTNLLERINAHDALRPYLATYPFGPEQVKLELDFRNRRGFPFFDGSLSSVRKYNGTLVYYKWNSYDDDTTRPLGPLVIAEEAYSEALQKVSSKQKIKKI